MPSLIEAIDIKRKSFFEYENAPYHCLDVEVSKPTARGGQTLVRLKMRNLITRAVFDKTFKAAEKFAEPDLVQVPATFQYSDGDAYHFMEDGTFETVSLAAATVGDDRELLVDNVLVKVQKFNGSPIALEFPPHVEMTVTQTEEGARVSCSKSAIRQHQADGSRQLQQPQCICNRRALLANDFGYLLLVQTEILTQPPEAFRLLQHR